MEVVSIGTTAPTCRLRERITRELQYLMDEGVTVEVRETPGRSYNNISVSVTATPQCSFSFHDLRTLGRQYTSSVLADFLIEEWEQAMLSGLLKKDFSYFNTEEQTRILSVSHKLLNSEELYQLSRRIRLRENIQQFLENHRHINADGFVRFRLQDYMQELRDTVSKAVDEYLVEKEYSEFIRLLRYFVEIQDPKLPLVHVVMTPEGYCQVFDEKHQQLHHEYLEDSKMEQDPEVSYEDLLISALITIAPKNVVLHVETFRGSLEMCETVRNIFEGRVTDCTSCDSCKASLSTQKTVTKPVAPAPRV